MTLTALEKKKIVSTFGCTKNSGSIEIQIALLSNQINKLQDHFSKNKKDYGSRLGLLKMVSHRRKLLNYLKKKYFSSYNLIIKKLSLRH